MKSQCRLWIIYKEVIYIYICISSRIYENRTIGLQEPTHLKLTQLK